MDNNEEDFNEEEYTEEDFNEEEYTEEDFNEEEYTVEDFNVEDFNVEDFNVEDNWEKVKKDISSQPTFNQLSQIGQARSEGVEEDLGTMLMEKKFERLTSMLRSAEEVFKILAIKIKEKYNLSSSELNDGLRVIKYLKQKNRGFRYKNPGAIIFGMMCLNGKNINKQRFDNVYENYAKYENMSKADLLRYCFLLIDIIP